MTRGIRTAFAHRSRAWRAMATAVMTACLSAACAAPGPLAPSTIPVTNNYVKLGGPETASTCGYTIFTIPLKNPAPLAGLIDDLIKSKGGDALVEITSQSTFAFYLLGWSQCMEVRGTVVRLPH